ncbi:porin [Comamonas sp. Y33R10-2]|uniref:porin n=1 Tax=Comamonas sp. Y33R10-2 TaxID=2853257 RepID=UPI001C5C90D0|nr:porin [Comamonas sp. Y33R10-2]QXZ08404.1 porin [Comamonas sp. Y33R10-2]
MKNVFIAMAAALACSGAAYAQSNVQLTGLVDMYAGSLKAPGGERTASLGSGGMTTSWWGIKGTEDLGGGLKADFNLTAFFRPDTGTPGRYDLAFGETFFSRDANVGLSGSFGRVGLGRGLAPNFLPTVFSNPFGDSFVISPLVLHANMGVSSANWYNTTTPADTGWSNQIVYSTPDMGGLKANLHYQFGEQTAAGQRGKKNVGLNVMYGNGPLNLVAFYERAQVNNPAGSSVIPTTSNWMVGGNYDFSVVKLYATYGQSKSKADVMAAGWTPGKNKTYSLGLDVPVNAAGTFKAAAAQTKAEPANGSIGGKRTTFTLGYNHFMSKRTDVYGAVMYDRVKFTQSMSGTSVAVGIRHRF